MFIDERHQEIMRLLGEQHRISVAEIVQRFGVSLDSARRDLRILEEKGLLKRTHGGAIPATDVRIKIPDHCSVRDIGEGTVHYNAVARKAAEYIRKDNTVYLGSASVHYLMTKYLPSDIPFTVVTNSIVIADELKLRENIEIYVIGGKMRRRGHMVDSLAVEFIRNMRLDLCFMTGAGYSAKFGLSNGTHETAAFQRAVIESSRKNICLATHNKIGFEGFVKVVDAQRFDLLITDWEALDEELTAIMDAGVEVVLAPDPGAPTPAHPAAP
ncbi:DeoR/GlpR family DNA-binding transcription regulator [Gorillibacterium sp. sgz5001074]|uniref:DeoR/GlpR family DNA-binding transcription regulator n=1 Tax=Gorillibacterium sp. sgz5001074 TaxID=3446695 RepID=UPI003F66D33D